MRNWILATSICPLINRMACIFLTSWIMVKNMKLDETSNGLCTSNIQFEEQCNKM